MHRYDRAQSTHANDCAHDARSPTQVQRFEHGREIERTDLGFDISFVGDMISQGLNMSYKTINVADEVDKHTNVGRLIPVAIHRERNENRGQDLIAKTRNSRTYTGSDIPGCGIVQLESPCQESRNDGCEPNIRKP